MFYSEIEPSEKLARFIKCYWVLEQTDPDIAGEPELILPDGCCEIVFNLADPIRRHCQEKTEIQPMSIFVGQMLQSVLIEPTEAVKIFGVRFYPEGIYPIVRESLSGLTDKIENLDTVLGELGGRLESQVSSVLTTKERIGNFERAVWEIIDREWEGDLVKNTSLIIREGKGRIRVEVLARKFGVSTKTLERHFNREIGISTKFFSRVVRLQEVLKLLNEWKEPVWADIAYSFGYADQAHLIKDFKDFAGVSPKVFHERQNSINDSFVG